MEKVPVFVEEGGLNVTNPFSWTRDPITGKTQGHAGIDITRWTGYSNLATICAIEDGVVVQIRDGIEGYDFENSEGNFVVISHGDAWVSKYFHLAAGSVKVGLYEKISAGDPIGVMGNTGNSSGAHLHFQLERDGVPVDPFPYLAEDSSILDDPKDSESALLKISGASSWAEDGVSWAVRCGILQGDGEGDFKLQDVCTREMMCVFLHRMYGLIADKNGKENG